MNSRPLLNIPFHLGGKTDIRNGTRFMSTKKIQMKTWMIEQQLYHLPSAYGRDKHLAKSELLIMQTTATLRKLPWGSRGWNTKARVAYQLTFSRWLLGEVALAVTDTLSQSQSSGTNQQIPICSRHTSNAVENVTGIRVKRAKCHTLIFSVLTNTWIVRIVKVI